VFRSPTNSRTKLNMNVPHHGFHLNRAAMVFIVLFSFITPASSFTSLSFSTKYRKNIVKLLPQLSSTKGSTLLEPSLDVPMKMSLNSVEQNEPTTETDSLLYGLLSTFQLLPPLALVDLPEPLDSIRRPVSYLYFVTTATILVILGAKRQDLKQGPQQKPITLKSAVLAPAVSSAVIFTIYLLLKYTNIEIYFDRLYQFLGKFTR
jgi:hypothetical protein